jgi:thiol-disulfide isomerase/thioredoxin
VQDAPSPETLPDERPQRRREYTGSASTLGVAILVILAVGVGIWFLELRGDGSAGRGDRAHGIVALPENLNPTGQAPAAQSGRAAPDFLLPLLDGAEARLTDYRGRYVLVNFWASWCPPCRAETPGLQLLSEQHRERLVVVGVNIQESEGAARTFARQFGLTYPIVLDRDAEVTNAYRARTPPISYLVDPTGVVVKVYLGPLDQEAIEALVREYLG